MSTFEVKIVRIDNVFPHPNADRLVIVEIGGFSAIANLKDDGSWRYQPGDLVVYIPADAVLPEWLLKEMGFWNADKNKGSLNGSAGNRVKPVKLRGVFSEGILYPVYQDIFGINQIKGDENNLLIHVFEGQDVAEFLNITKWEPVIPQSMAGEVFSITKLELMERHGLSDFASASFSTVKYDIEAWEKHVNLFEEGELIIIREKLHGTFCGISVFPDVDSEDLFESIDGQRNVMIYSKGLGGKGLCFKNNEQNANNLYVTAYKNMPYQTKSKLTKLAKQANGFHMLGEVAGRGVQDLHYSLNTPEFFAFDFYTNRYPQGKFADANYFEELKFALDIQEAPVLGVYPYSRETILKFRDGNTTLGNQHIREGVVIRPVLEKFAQNLPNQRLQLKVVSPEYKLRKNATEFN